MNDQAAIADVKAIVQKHGYDGGIFIGFQHERDDGLHLVSYGRNRALCKAMRTIGDQLFDRIQDGTVKLPR